MQTTDEALIELTRVYNELLSEYNRAMDVMEVYCPSEITNTFNHYYERAEHE